MALIARRISLRCQNLQRATLRMLNVNKKTP